jgi:predicted nuclease of predicted toxin-antitoxin system
MKILFDQGTPVPLRKFLAPHLIRTAHEMGWSRLENGDLLAAAEAEGFELLVTTDQNLRYQQNLQARRIAILVLTTTSWPKIQRRVAEIVAAVNSTEQGDYAELAI